MQPELVRDPSGTGVLVSRLGKDRGTPERAQHAEVIIEGDKEPHAKAISSPLDRYHRRRELHKDPDRNDILWAAGDRLRGDFYLAGLSPKVTADLTSLNYGRGEMSDNQVAARQRYRAACVSLDMELWACVRTVCCEERPAAEWAAGRGRRGRQAEIAGMTVLQLGLEALARHYGLDATERSVYKAALVSRSAPAGNQIRGLSGLRTTESVIHSGVRDRTDRTGRGKK